MFLDSLRSPDGKFPEKLEEDVLRPALVARFRMARLYSKLICSLPSAQLENLNKSLDNYTYEDATEGCSLWGLMRVISRAVKVEAGMACCLSVKSTDFYFHPAVPALWPSTARTILRQRLLWRRSWSSVKRWPSCSLSKSTVSNWRWQQTTEGCRRLACWWTTKTRRRFGGSLGGSQTFVGFTCSVKCIWYDAIWKSKSPPEQWLVSDIFKFLWFP